MKKVLFIVAAFALSSVAILGCRVEGEVGDEVSTPLSLPR